MASGDWLDWLEPSAEYHTNVDELIDAGEGKVVCLIRDRARRDDSDAEFQLSSGSIWEIRDGRIVRVEFFGTREDALAAAGLTSS